MNKQITVTRRSKIGFGYNTGATREGRIDKPESPDFTGTFNTVREKIAADRNYQSMKNSVIMSTAWFVKVDGSWVRLDDPQQDWQLGNLNYFPEVTINL